MAVDGQDNANLVSFENYAALELSKRLGNSRLYWISNIKRPKLRVLIANYHRFLWERVYDVASKYCIFCFRTSVVKEVRGANESVLWPSRWQGYVYRIDAKNPYSIHREGGKKLGQWLAETNLWDWCKSIFLALGEWRGDTKLTFTLFLWLSCRINSKTRKVYKNG